MTFWEIAALIAIAVVAFSMRGPFLTAIIMMVTAVIIIVVGVVAVVVGYVAHVGLAICMVWEWLRAICFRPAPPVRPVRPTGPPRGES